MMMEKASPYLILVQTLEVRDTVHRYGQVVTLSNLLPVVAILPTRGEQRTQTQRCLEIALLAFRSIPIWQSSFCQIS